MRLATLIMYYIFQTVPKMRIRVGALLENSKPFHAPLTFLTYIPSYKAKSSICIAGYMVDMGFPGEVTRDINPSRDIGHF